jgi:beta-lactamase regulating signal transducer with metallopeptidase domain
VTFSFLQEDAVQTLGWTLLHSLWELSAVAAFVATLLYFQRRAAATMRYLTACIGLLLMAAVPVATYAVLLPPAAPARGDLIEHSHLEGDVLYIERMVSLPASPAGEAVAPATRVPLQARAVAAVRPLLPYAVAAYFVGTLFVTARLAGGYWSLRRLRREAQPALAEWNVAAAALARTLGLPRGVRLVQSAAVDVPAVLGVFRPIVLLPAAALTGLSPGHLEALLAHELAHIRRWDPLANAVQVVIDTLLFYHPAVRWLSARIRQEREHCCDDLAVAAAGGRAAYARALLEMEARRGPAPHAALALAADGGRLLPRVRRLLAPPPAGRPRPATRLVTAGTAALAVSLIAGIAYVVGCSKPADGPAAAPPGAPAPAPTAPVAQPTSDTDTAEAAARAKLDADVNEFVIDGQPLDAVFDTFQQSTGLKLVVNWPVLEQAGIRKDKPVRISLRRIPARKLLTTLLAEAGEGEVRYVIDQGTIVISTRAALDAHRQLVTHVYDIRDLLVQPIDTTKTVGTAAPATRPAPNDVIVAQVIDTIESTVAPGSWKDRGGIGSIQELNGQFVIQQTAEHHEEIGRILNQLRETRALQVAVEARLLAVPDSFRVGWDLPLPSGFGSGNVGATTPNNLNTSNRAILTQTQAPGVTPGEFIGATVIDNWTLNRFLAAAQADKRTVTVTIPRLTLYNGIAGAFAQTNAVNYVGGWKKNADGTFQPTMDTLRTGFILNIEATMSADRKKVVTRLQPLISVLTKMETRDDPTAGPGHPLQVPAVQTIDLHDNPQLLSIPDGGTALIQLGELKGNLFADAHATTTGPGAVDTQPTTAGKRLLLLVKPTIILRRELPESPESPMP